MNNLNLVSSQGTERVQPCVVPVQDKITFTTYTSTEPLSKRYWTDKGLIQKQAAAKMYKGTAVRVTMPFAEFPNPDKPEPKRVNYPQDIVLL